MLSRKHARPIAEHELFGPAQPLQRRSAMPLAVLVFGFASILVLVATSNIGDRTSRQFELLERCVDRLELDLAHSHLWLEEYFAGDDAVDLDDDVWAHLDDARDVVRAMRFGGPLLEDRLEPLEDPELLRLAQVLDHQLGEFLSASRARYGAAEGSGVGSTPDQAYDAIFRAFNEQAELFRSQVDLRLHAARRQTELWQSAVIGAWGMIVVAAVAGLLTRERRLRAAFATIERSRRWLASTLSSIGDGVATTDLEGRLTYLNPVAEEMVGRRLAEAVGRKVEQVVRIRGAGEVFERPVDSILAGEGAIVADAPRVLVAQSGAEVSVDFGAAPIQGAAPSGGAPIEGGEHGHLQGAVLVFRDASRRLDAEAALRRREAELRQSQKLEAVGRLAGGIAHDVSNYLGAIRGYCEVAVMKKESGAALQRRMNSAIDTCHKVSALIRQLLAFSRRQPAQPEVVDLGRVVGDLEALMKRLLGEDLKVEMLSENGPHRIVIDPAQIEQVLVNLLVNARDAMPDGGRLTIRLSTEQLGPEHVGGPGEISPGRFVCLEVSDTGTGIPEEIRGQIFEPFFSTKQGDHSGLGLAMVYGIVHQNGGFLTVDSAEDEGASFKLYFPATGREPDSRSVAPKPVLVRPANRRVLLVEDNEAMRESTHDLLTALGHDTVVADSAESALEITERDLAFDLVITDVVMPGLSGKDLADRLRQRQSAPPVLFISGYTDRVTLFDGGDQQRDRPVHFLEKPFGGAELSEKIASIVEGRRRGSSKTSASNSRRRADADAAV